VQTHTRNSKDEIFKPILELPSDSAGDPQSFLDRRKVFNIELGENARAFLEPARVIEQAVAGAIMEISLYRRKRGPARRDLSYITNAIILARKLVEAGSHHPSTSQTRRRGEFAWCESRLLMHLSQCYVFDAEYKQSNPKLWQEAMKALIESERSLAEQPIPQRRNTDLALIDLYRAEVRLREADSVIVRRKGQVGSSFRNLRSEMRVCCSKTSATDAILLEGTRRDVKALFGKADKLGESSAEYLHSLQVVKSLVRDAVMFLKRAEKILQGRRRNVWWTTWLFERHIRATAMLIWASVPEANNSLPALGFEHAPRRTDTVADIMLLDALRMVRLDAYRLATVVDSYADCALALRTRLICGKDMPLMPYRQQYMVSNLTYAVGKLQEIEDTRSQSLMGGDTYVTTMTDYVKRVRDGVRAELSGCLAFPIA